MLLSARDYGSIQEALDAAENGDRLYIPAGLWAAPGGALPKSWKITKSLEIFGDGPSLPGSTTGTTLIRNGSSSLPVFEITPPVGGVEVGNVYIHDLKIDGPQPGSTAPSSPAPAAFVCTIPAGTRLRSLRISRVRVEKVTGYATTATGYLFEAPSPGAIESLSMSSCYATEIDGVGVSFKNVGIARLNLGGGGQCFGGWLKAESSAVACYVVECEHSGYAPTAGQGEMLLLGCQIAHIEACRYEAFEDATIPTPLEFRNCGGAALAMSNSFVKSDALKATTGIRISAASTADTCSVTAFSNNFIRVYGEGSNPGAMIDATASRAGVVVFPQFDDGRESNPQPGEIKLPSFPNKGLFAAPSVVSRGQAQSPAKLTGLVVPSGTSLPTASVQNGMLFFVKFTEEEALYVRVNGHWRSVFTG